MSMITGLDSALDGKVDKVNGKGLSTEDYTTAEKNKLAGIAAGANKYVHPSTHPVGMITGLGTAATENTGTSSGNVPVIESNGKLPAVIIPSDDGKQDKLTFDTSPKSGSTNPVTSAGIYTALAGKANSKHNQGHDTITFNPEANKEGDVFLLDRGYVDTAGACRTAFMPADAITVEYTQDGGMTWKPYNLTDAQKQGLFSMNRSFFIKLGGPNATAQTIGHGVRITVEPVDRYTNVDTFYCWFSSASSSTKCSIERSTIEAKNTFTTIRSNVPVSGNSGPNSITFAAGSFGGSADQTSNFYSYRFTFMTTAIHPTITSVPTVTDLRLYGDRVWRIPNQMMFNGHLYSWDTAQNATFPAQLSAPNMSAESGNVDNILKVGRTFYNVINLISTKNIREIVIYTKIPLVNRMISLYITGYEYNSKGAVDLKISYNYDTANNQYRQYSATSSCGWKPDIYLFTYTGDDGVTYTAIGLQVLSSPNIYYPRLTVAMYDQWSDNNDYSKGWTTDYVLADAAEGETLISNNKLKVPYNNPTAADVGALSLAGGTLTGELVPNGGLAHVGTDGYIAYPDGGQINNDITKITGMLKITLPVSWSSTMLKLKVSIFNLNNGSSVEYILAGYNHSTNKLWMGATAYCVSSWGGLLSNLPVSFGHDGTKCAITIGTPTTAWNYPRVSVNDIRLASQNINYDQWKSGWSLSFVTEALPTVNTTISNTNITYNVNHAATADKVTNKLTAGSKTYDGSAAVTLTAADLGAATTSHTHIKAQITDFPTSLPANGGKSDYANMLSVLDTHNENLTPAQIYEEKKKIVRYELKVSTAIGLTIDLTGHMYVALLTIAPWADKSGGWPVQIAYCQNGKIFRRISNADGSAWLDWEDTSGGGSGTGQTWHAKDILGSETTSAADSTAQSGYSVTIDTTAKNLNGSAKKYKAPFGTYVAIFRVQASTVTGSADKVKLEIWGTSAAIASRTLKLSDFSVASKWEYFKIPFETDSSSGRDIYPKVTCLNATGNVKVDNIVVVPNAFALM